MLFHGADLAERVALLANRSRLTFLRDPGNIEMDTAGVERVDFAALGGADVVTLNDLSGTDVHSVNVDLAGGLGGAGGDGQPDRVVVNGTSGDDAITVSGDSGGVKVGGLAATVGILRGEAANDRLEINTLDGRDTVDSSGLAAARSSSSSTACSFHSDSARQSWEGPVRGPPGAPAVNRFAPGIAIDASYVTPLTRKHASQLIGRLGDMRGRPESSEATCQSLQQEAKC